MKTQGVVTGVRLDGPTYAALRALADQRTDGNASLVMRQIVRQEAAKCGLWPTAGQNVTPAPASEARR